MSDPTPSNSPTVVLVHGAFADGSSWNGVIERLQARGVQVTAPANPLRGISVDSTYTASVFEQTPGPVLAVGHSYGGAVITNAAALVEFMIDPARVHDVFAADLPEEPAALAGAIQRPVAELAFSEPSGAPAWKALPAWAVVALSDRSAGTDVVRSMAERAGATITEVEGSHVIMISQPDTVTDVIIKALAAVEAPAPVG